MISDLAIIGAGPYGLSLAAHLRNSGLTFRIFGTPMQSWRENMPKGMHLKSEPFASNLYDPAGSFTLRDFCREKGLPYTDIGSPVPLQTFIDYGMEFQRRFAPALEETKIQSVQRVGAGFELTTEDGQTVHARRVVVATGLSHFSYLPAVISGLPRELVTHSSDHAELGQFRGRQVLVIGAGASALDTAALLHEAGAQVELVARRNEIAFHSFIAEPRPLLQRLRNPRSGLGIGWRSRLSTDAPMLFHLMPEDFRVRVVRNHLGPAPGWFIRERVRGKFPMHLGASIQSVLADKGQVRLKLTQKSGTSTELVADHVIAATGYSVSVSRLGFLDAALRSEISTVEDTPVLNRHFETSVRGLYIVGVASANSFGPMTRFAFGAGFTARRVSKHLAARARTSKATHPQAESVRLATK